MDNSQNQAAPTESISLDAIFDLLAHHRRRQTLACLREHGSLALADLAEEIACHERDQPITEIPEEKALRVYSALWHSHIPKLAENDVVEYDQEMDTVRLGENAELVERVILSDAPEEPRSA